MEFHGDCQLQLTATRYQLEVLKHTSVERALLRMVITRSNRISVQALYRMRSNRQRLEIQLPAQVTTGQIEFERGLSKEKLLKSCVVDVLFVTAFEIREVI